MKRYLGVLTAFIVFFAVLHTASAEDFAQKRGLLDALGITELFRGDDELDKTVTRAEFADIASAFAPGISSDFRPLYNDVDKATPYSGSITKAANAGYMIGDGSGSFYPEQEITGSEAVIVCMKILGFEEMSERRGGYLEGYINAARTAGFTAYGEGSITRKQMIDLLYDLLMNNVMEPVAYGERSEYSMSERTLLEAMFSVYKSSGRVTMTEAGGLYSQDRSSKGTLLIEDHELYYDSDAADMLGINVNYYYKDDDDGDILVYMYENGKDDIVVLKSDEIDSYSRNTYYYKYKNKTARLSLGVTTVYNGCMVPFSELGAEDLVPADGSVKLIGVSGSGLYDIVIITNCEYYTVQRVNATDLIIYDKYGKPPLDMNTEKDADRYITARAYGKDVAVTYYKAGDVLRVVKSRNGDRVQVDMISKKYSGSPKRIDAEEEKITLGDEEHSVYRGLMAAVTDANGNVIREAIDINSQGSFYINDDGMIVAYEQSTDSVLETGFILGAYYMPEEDDYIKIAFRILSDEKPVTYFSAEKVFYTSPEDGIKRRYTAEELYEKLPKDGTGNIKRDVYLFRINDDGLLDELVPPVDKTADSSYPGYAVDFFAKDWDRTGVRIYGQQIGTKYLPNGSTKVFKVPNSAEASESVYQKGNMSEVFGSDSRDMHISVYGSDEERVPKAVVQWTDDAGTLRSSVEAVIRTNPMIISRKTKKILDDGEAGYSIAGYRNGTTVEFDIASDVGGYSTSNWGYGAVKPEILTTGDIIDFEMNASGQIAYILPLLLMSDTASAKRDNVNMGTTSDYDALGIMHTLYGHVVKTTATTLTVNARDDMDAVYDRVYKSNTANVILVEDGKVEKISINDVNRGDVCFIRDYHHILYDVVIYR